MNQSNEFQNVRQRQAQRAALRKKKAQQRRRLQLLVAACAALLVLVILLAILLSQCGKKDTPIAAETSSVETSLSDDVMATIPQYTLTASQYFVFDCFVDSFVSISENEDARIFPASITKLMTADVALQYLDPDAQITAGEALNLVAAGSSVAGLEKGDTLTVKELIGGMLLPSGNDAAYVLATEAGRIILDQPTADATTATAAFVSKMNLQAIEYGMHGTHFANPDGIHKEDHYTTYRDLVIMAKTAIASPTIMEYCAMTNVTVTTKEGRTLTWHNTNLLIDSGSEYYSSFAIGLKTGQTPSAGSCLLSAFNFDGKLVIVGIFGCPDVESRFADTLHLMQAYAR